MGETPMLPTMPKPVVIYSLSLVLAALTQVAGAGTYPAAPDSQPARTNTVAYLGVTAKPVDDTLRAQLNLPDDVGLTVTTLDHKGPSASDLHVNDVLEKLDDQLLIDAHQLVALIHLHKAGETVTITLLRKSKEMQVKIKLGEKRIVDDAGHSVSVPNGVAPDGGAPDVGTPDDLISHPPFESAAPMGLPQVMMSFKDDAYSAEVRVDKQGHRKMLVKDAAKKKVAEGLIDTPEQWEKFPLDIRDHLEVMHKMLTEQK